MTDVFSRKKRSEIMSLVKNKNTDIELILRKKLWAKGFRYRTNYKIIGRPDIVLPKFKAAIFCDGDFWHGRKYKKEVKNYKKFWKNKIETNINRDKTVNKELRKIGWTVIRFWKSQILKNADKCVNDIIKIIQV